VKGDGKFMPAPALAPFVWCSACPLVHLSIQFKHLGGYGMRFGVLLLTCSNRDFGMS
jgi:hypothetical protein